MPGIGDYTTPSLTVDPYDNTTTVATLTAYEPDGTSTAVAVTKSAGGHVWTATAPVLLDQAGWWVFLWTVTGNGAGSEPQRVYVDPNPAASTTPLFTATEYGLYLGSTASDDQYALAHALVLDEFEGVVGEGIITDPPQKGLKKLALEVAKRMSLNPGGLRERAIDDYREVYATETLASGLTDDEIARLRALTGTDEAASAFTIRPGGPSATLYPSETAYVLQRRYPWA